MGLLVRLLTFSRAAAAQERGLEHQRKGQERLCRAFTYVPMFQMRPKIATDTDKVN